MEQKIDNIYRIYKDNDNIDDIVLFNINQDRLNSDRIKIIKQNNLLIKKNLNYFKTKISLQ